MHACVLVYGYCLACASELLFAVILCKPYKCEQGLAHFACHSCTRILSSAWGCLFKTVTTMDNYPHNPSPPITPKACIKYKIMFYHVYLLSVHSKHTEMLVTVLNCWAKWSTFLKRVKTTPLQIEEKLIQLSSQTQGHKLCPAAHLAAFTRGHTIVVARRTISTHLTGNVRLLCTVGICSLLHLPDIWTATSINKHQWRNKEMK